jgi:hypothetical protein
VGPEVPRQVRDKVPEVLEAATNNECTAVSHHNANLDALADQWHTQQAHTRITTTDKTTSTPSAPACSSPDLRNMINGEGFWMNNWYVDKK